MFTKGIFTKTRANLLALVFSLSLSPTFAVVNEENSIVNADNWTVSLLTCSSGSELYSAYGHSALRLCNEYRGVDAVFNYGTFDFNTPYFYLKFLNGQLDYKLSVSSFARFMNAYAYDGRGVTERQLILSNSEAETLASALIDNSKPQNCFYRYDFFFDNCATRIRDMVFKTKSSNLDPKVFKSDFCNESFRDCLHKFVSPNEWSGQGIDLILGVRADKSVSKFDKAYLPDYLDALFVEAGVVGTTNVLLTKRDEETSFSLLSFFSPIVVSCLLVVFIVCISCLELKRSEWFKHLDYILFSITLVFAFIFWYLWIVSEIKITSHNLNVLWASILYVPLLRMLRKGKTSSKPFLRICVVNSFFIAGFYVVALCGVQYASPLAMALSFCLLIRNLLFLKRNHFLCA